MKELQNKCENANRNGKEFTKASKEGGEITKQAGKRIYIFELNNRKYTEELGVAVTV